MGGSDIDRWRKYGSYSIYNYASDGRGLLVDKVVKLEEIDTELACILASLSPPCTTIPNIDKSRLSPGGDSKRYRSYYTEGSRRLVATMYAREIEKFGYEF